MRNFVTFIFSLVLSASSFGQILALGEKSSYLHADKLEQVSLWDLVEFSCMCHHLQWYPADKIPNNTKLVIGIKKNPMSNTEALFIIENSDDTANSMQCDRDYVSYYFISADYF